MIAEEGPVSRIRDQSRSRARKEATKVAPSVRPQSTGDACAPGLSERSDWATCEIDIG